MSQVFLKDSVRTPLNNLKVVVSIYCFIFVAVCSATSQRSETPSAPFNKVKIAFLQDDPPLSMRLPSGKPAGYLVEFWQLWAKTNHMTIEWVGGNFAENISALKTGKVDFQAGLFESEARREWAIFSIPITQVRTAIYFLPEVYRGQELSKNNTPVVSVGQGSYQESVLRRKYPTIKLHTFIDGQMDIKALLNQQIDAIVAEVPYMNAQLGLMGIRGALIKSKQKFSNNTEHAIFLKSRRELKNIIDNGIKEIPLEAIQNLEKKWFQDEPSYFADLINAKVPSLNLSQIEWLTRHHNLSIGISTDLPPFEFLDDKGEYRGIGADYIQRIEEMLKIKLTPQKGLSWNEVLSAIKQGKIDLLPMAVKSKKRQQYLRFTQSYLRFPLVIATHKRSIIIKGLENLSGKRVAVEKGNPAEALLARDYPEIKIIGFDTVIEAMNDLDAAKVDAVVHNSAVISHLQKQQQYENIEIAAFTEYDLKISMAVRKQLSPFADIIELAIQQIDKSERSSINNKWLAIQVDFSEQLKRFFMWAVPIVSILILIFLYVVKTNQRLQVEINKRRRVELSLEKAKNNAVLASRAKDDFLANMSHEIRTPMNAVIGMSDLLFLSKLDDKQKQYIETLKTSSKALLNLINQILDLSKMEAGKLQIESVEFDLHNLVAFFSDNIKINKGNKFVKPILAISPEVPKKVIGDEFRLRQLIENLVDNAMKFTEKGIIKISVSLDRQVENRLYLHFIVSDTGIGIEPDRLAVLFDEYSTQESSDFNQVRGGMGLTICLKLCKLMKGNLWVESELGKGSDFHFIVQVFESISCIVDQAEADIATKLVLPLSNSLVDQNRKLAGKKILLVDDNQTNRMIAQKMLERVGIQVVIAKNGMESLLVLSEITVDAVLMDLQMPIMDGYLATKKIREQSQFTHLPIIALSANVAKKDVQDAFECGMNRHLPKPIVMKDLYSTLIEML